MSLHINSLGILSFTSCLLSLIMIYWKPARVCESQLAESILEGNGQLAFKKLATATLETLMPEYKEMENLSMLGGGWCMHPRFQVYFRLQASMVRQMKDSEMGTQVDFNLSATKPASITPPIRAI